MSNVENQNLYYELELFLDPPETNAVRLIELLKTKQSEWRKKVNTDPLFELFVQNAKIWIQKIEQKQEPLEPLAKEARAKRLKELRAAILEVERDGLLERHEFDYLIKTFGGNGRFFNVETIESELHLPISCFTPPQEPRRPPGVKIVSALEMDAIDKDLKILNDGRNENEPILRNLYDFLTLSPSSDPETTLKNRASELSEIIRRKPKNDPRVNAESRLIGKALIFFKNADSKAGYDLALGFRPIDELKKTKFAIRALGKSVSRDDYNLSIDEIMECGLNREEAEWQVYDFYCNKRRCPRPTGSNSTDRRIQCPNCFRLNDPETAICSCGSPLKIVCPKCGRNVASNAKVCSECGFAVGNMPNAVLQIEEARRLLANGQISDAQERLRRAEIWWPNNPESNRLSETIRDREEARRRQKTQIATLESKINESIRRQNYFQTQKSFVELRVLQPNSPLLDQEKRVAAIIAETRTKLDAIQRTSNLAERTRLCEDVLSRVADCEEVRAIMESLPPFPPAELKARAVSTGISLNWRESPSKLKTGYFLVRKTNGVPASPKDGVVLADDLTDSQFLDATALPGIVYGYAVYSQRGQIRDSTGTRSELVQSIADVSDVRLEPGDRSISFDWTPIPDAIGLKITRWEKNSTQEAGDFYRLSNRSGYVDTNLENDKRYSYRIQTLFRGIQGEDVLSSGIVVDGTPRKPPSVIRNLSVEILGDSIVQLRWTKPEQGDLYFFYPNKRPEKNEGQTEFTTLESLTGRFGKFVPVPKRATEKLKVRIATSGVRYFFPITYENGLAVFGNLVSATLIADVEDLYFERVDSGILLTWNWPKGIETVLIQIRRDSPPSGFDDFQSRSFFYTKKEYRQKKGFYYNEPNTNCYFAVYSYIESGPSYSKGIVLSTDKTVLRYDLTLKKSWASNRTKAEIVVQVESKEGRLPALSLRKDFGRPPLNRNYGEEILAVPPSDQRKETIELPLETFEKNAFVKLFVAEFSEEQFYSFNAPARENLKLEFVPKSTLSRLISLCLTFFRRFALR